MPTVRIAEIPVNMHYHIVIVAMISYTGSQREKTVNILMIPYKKIFQGEPMKLSKKTREIFLRIINEMIESGDIDDDPKFTIDITQKDIKGVPRETNELKVRD
jgi:hypothetical protein